MSLFESVPLSVFCTAINDVFCTKKVFIVNKEKLGLHKFLLE